ncbi:hypothetical protein RRSWK_03306 [Rhodopirellula sp. SWK7]|nr:hypothetical protein RRSWK_03306 [Rhodopirellula sp. SWK7]
MIRRARRSQRKRNRKICIKNAKHARRTGDSEGIKECIPEGTFSES